MSRGKGTSRRKSGLFLIIATISSVGSLILGLVMLFLHPRWEPDLSFFETFLAVLIGLAFIWIGFYLLNTPMEYFGARVS